MQGLIILSILILIEAAAILYIAIDINKKWNSLPTYYTGTG